MSLLDVVLGRRCDMCGRRGSDVTYWQSIGMALHSKCKRQLRQADRG